MRTRIQRWGNSLALRIPRALAEEVHIDQNTEVEVTLVDGKMMVKPVGQSAWMLEQLLSGITDENLHSEVNTGPAIGKEAW